MKIPIKLVYQYMVIFLNFSPTSNHLHPLQVENCDSNSRLVVDEDDNGIFGLERVKRTNSKSHSICRKLAFIPNKIKLDSKRDRVDLPHLIVILVRRCTCQHYICTTQDQVDLTLCCYGITCLCEMCKCA